MLTLPFAHFVSPPFSLNQYIEARDRLIRKDLIAFEVNLIQVLGLPKQTCLDPNGIFKKPFEAEEIYVDWCRKDAALAQLPQLGGYNYPNSLILLDPT
jgi:hypothetical protein